MHFLLACQEDDPPVWMKISGPTQGTIYNITYCVPDSTDYQQKVEHILREFDLSLSTYIDESLISRFNRGEKGLEADHYMSTCYNCAWEVYEATSGAFDITVAPVVNAWGFGFTERAEVDPPLIDSLLLFVGMDKTRIENGILYKDDHVMLDMNAIAQGYAVDVLVDFFSDEGLTDFLVEIGGELRCRGSNPRGENWKVGIDKPVEGLQIPGAELQAVVAITDRSLATSGNYRKFYISDGMKYSHTIDPETGYPVQHGLLSATVLAGDCMRADAYATSFMVMGYEKSKEFLETHRELDAYLIYNDLNGDFRVWYTEGLRESILRGI